LTHWSAAAARP